jgi:hypothetical protein
MLQVKNGIYDVQYAIRGIPVEQLVIQQIMNIILLKESKKSRGRRVSSNVRILFEAGFDLYRHSAL